MKFLLIAALGCVTIYATESDQKSISAVESQRIWVRPLLAQRYLTFGYDELMADAYWIRVIQDFGTCDKVRRDNTQPMYTTLDSIVEDKSNMGTCPDSWVFSMIDMITDLAPHFKLPYYAGSLDLLVGTDDVVGGGVILEKGLRVFPKDWRLAYQAAYYHLYDGKDISRAADLLLHAHQNGGPKWLPVLASRLYSKTDRDILARSVLEEYIRTNPGGEAEERARKRLQELSAPKK